MGVGRPNRKDYVYGRGDLGGQERRACAGSDWFQRTSEEKDVVTVDILSPKYWSRPSPRAIVGVPPLAAAPAVFRMPPIKPAHFAPLGLWILLSVAACATPPGGARSPLASDPTADLQLLLDSAVQEGLPGVSAAVATRRGVVWIGVAGDADLEVGAPVHPDMLFGIGSISKVFVATVVLQLAEEGEIALSSTVESILGASVAGVPNAGTAQLLNHTSGIPSWEDDPAWIREGRGGAAGRKPRLG